MVVSLEFDGDAERFDMQSNRHQVGKRALGCARACWIRLQMVAAGWCLHVDRLDPRRFHHGLRFVGRGRSGLYPAYSSGLRAAAKHESFGTGGCSPDKSSLARKQFCVARYACVSKDIVIVQGRRMVGDERCPGRRSSS
jgi:hypothetical protein